MDFRKCNKCGEDKLLEDFPKCSSKPLGVDYKCKSCKRAYNKSYQSNLTEDEKQILKDKNKIWRENNSESLKLKNKIWKDNNRDHVNSYNKIWREDNKDWMSNYYQENKKEIKAYISNWKQQNKEKVNKYFQDRYNSDPNFKLLVTLRVRVYQILKGIKDDSSSLEFLGCSIDTYREHLEKQFTSEMNWGNYGSYWEVDHIIPLSKGGSFHYSNTQPLTINENRVKSDKIL